MTPAAVRTIVLEAELTAPLPELGPDSDVAVGYHRALVLGRVHGRPVSLADVPLPASATELESALRGAVEPALSDLLPARPFPATVPGPAPNGLLPATIAVVIPTRNRLDGVRRAVDSVLGCDWPRDQLEVFIIDSASSTDSVARLGEQLHVAGLPVTALRENRPGASLARNLGLAHARSEIIAFTDDDVIVDRGWLREIARAFTDPVVDVVSGLVLPVELETAAQHWFEQYGGFSASRGLTPQRYDLDENLPENPLFPWGTAELGSSNSLAFRTDVLRGLGGFDEALGAGTVVGGGEDTELLRRVVLRGHTVAFAPEAVAWHEHRRELASLRRQLFGYGRGLTASLVKTLLDDPRELMSIVQRIPAATRYAFLPSGSKNARKADYPASLTALELAGMLVGPVAYAISRRRVRAARRGAKAA